MKRYTSLISALLDISASRIQTPVFDLKNFGLLLQIKNKALLTSIARILCSRIRKVISGEPVCMEGCIHERTMESMTDLIKSMCDYEIVDPSIFSFMHTSPKSAGAGVFDI